MAQLLGASLGRRHTGADFMHEPKLHCCRGTDGLIHQVEGQSSLSADDGFEATAKACHRAHAPRQIPVLKAGLALGKACVGLQEHCHAATDEGAVRGAHDRHGQVG